MSLGGVGGGWCFRRMKQPLQGEVLIKGRDRYELQPVWWPRTEGQRDPVSRTRRPETQRLFQRSSEWFSDEPEKGGELEAVLGNLCVHSQAMDFDPVRFDSPTRLTGPGGAHGIFL